MPHLYRAWCREPLGNGRDDGAVEVSAQVPPQPDAPNWQNEFERAQATRSVNIVCMKWGDRYGPEWVNRLYGMVARNTTWAFRFVCFTDNAAGIRDDA